jgi:hypothetical protein
MDARSPKQLAQQTCTRFFFNGRTGRDAPQEIPKESWSKLMICDDHCKILMVGKHHNVVNPTINHPLLTRSD